MKTSYFTGCLRDGRFAEGANLLVKLPDEEPERMMLLIRFLYTDTVPEYAEIEENSRLEKFVSMYIVAHRYCAERLCARALALAATAMKTVRIKWCHFHELGKAELQGSNMWSLFVREAVRECCESFCNLKILLEDGLQSNGDAAVDILQEFANLHGSSWVFQSDEP